MLRTMLESLTSEKSGRGKDKSFRKDLDSATVTAIEAFLRRSLFYPYLLKFDQMLKECGDLSQLWYREFFLELTMGQRIQVSFIHLHNMSNYHAIHICMFSSVFLFLFSFQLRCQCLGF